MLKPLKGVQSVSLQGRKLNSRSPLKIKRKYKCIPSKVSELVWSGLEWNARVRQYRKVTENLKLG